MKIRASDIGLLAGGIIFVLLTALMLFSTYFVLSNGISGKRWIAANAYILNTVTMQFHGGGRYSPSYFELIPHYKYWFTTDDGKTYTGSGYGVGTRIINETQKEQVGGTSNTQGVIYYDPLNPNNSGLSRPGTLTALLAIPFLFLAFVFFMLAKVTVKDHLWDKNIKQLFNPPPETKF